MLERQEDRFIPLPLAADRIVSEILSERRTASELRFLSQVRAQSKIWTVFDTNQPTTATPQVAATAPRQSFATILVKNDRENLDVAVGQATHQVLPSMNTAIPPLAPQPASP